MSEELKYAIQVAKEAGEKILKRYDDERKISEKLDGTFVTEVDKEIDGYIQKRLRELSPHPILSEEGKDDLSRLSAEYLWSVDPIDGTFGFIKKDSYFAVQIGLTHNGRPILGVVYRPTNEDLYYAELNKGSYLEKSSGEPKRLSVSKEDNLRKMKMIIHPYGHYDLEKKMAEDLSVVDFIRAGGAGIRIGLVAQGESAICINAGHKSSEWDTCAPQIILEEAGGRMTDICGGELLYNQKNVLRLKGFVGTNKLVHDEAIRIISKMLC